MTVDWTVHVVSPSRLRAVERVRFVWTDRVDPLDGLIELATELTGAPRGCVTLVTRDRTTALSSVGFPEGSALWAPIEMSFCRFVIGTGRPFIVDDARTDPRTIDDPAIELFGADAWAGYGIYDDDGELLGTFCVMDPQPHAWSRRDLLVLATLANAASTEIVLRRAIVDLDAARATIAQLDGPDRHL